MTLLLSDPEPHSYGGRYGAMATGAGAALYGPVFR
jgi:hypothetical protein